MGWVVTNFDKSIKSIVRKLERKAKKAIGEFDRPDLTRDLREVWVDIVQRTTWHRPTPAPRSHIYLDEVIDVEGKTIQYGWRRWPGGDTEARMRLRTPIFRQEMRPIVKRWVREALRRGMR